MVDISHCLSDEFTWCNRARPAVQALLTVEHVTFKMYSLNDILQFAFISETSLYNISARVAYKA